MNKIIALMIVMGTVAFAEKEIKTCKFMDEHSEGLSYSPINCFSSDPKYNNTSIEKMYQDGWELKTTYYPWHMGGKKWDDINYGGVLFFEREAAKKIKK